MKRSFFDRFGIGIIVILIGCWFVGKQLGIIDFGLGKVILLAVGISIIFYGIKMMKGHNDHERKDRHQQNTWDDDTWSKYNPNRQAPPPPPPMDDESLTDNKFEHDFYTASKHGYGDSQESKSKFEQDFENASKQRYEESEHHKAEFDQQWKQQWREQKQDWREQKQEWKQGWRQQKHEWKQQWRQQKHHWKGTGHDHQYDHTFQEYGSSKINRSTFIGDFHFGKDYWELKPMNLSAFIGDTTIDLTKAQIPLGETKIIISAFIGDIKVFVPNDSAVGIKVQMNSFIGDSKFMNEHESGMMKHVNHESMYYHETERQVMIIVSTFIGDVKVKKVG